MSKAENKQESLCKADWIKASNIFHQLKYMESTPGIELIVKARVEERKATLEGSIVYVLVRALETIIKHQAFVGGKLADLSTTARIAKEALDNFTRLKDSMK